MTNIILDFGFRKTTNIINFSSTIHDNNHNINTLCNNCNQQVFDIISHHLTFYYIYGLFYHITEEMSGKNIMVTPATNWNISKIEANNNTYFKQCQQ